jgi:hypothetical protein
MKRLCAMLVIPFILALGVAASAAKPLPYIVGIWTGSGLSGVNWRITISEQDNDTFYGTMQVTTTEPIPINGYLNGNNIRFGAASLRYFDDALGHHRRAESFTHAELTLVNNTHMTGQAYSTGFMEILNTGEIVPTGVADSFNLQKQQ